jgi:hypothetical protein
MAVSRAKGVLVDKLAEHDSFLLADLPDEEPLLGEDFSDWHFNRLDQETELL